MRKKGKNNVKNVTDMAKYKKVVNNNMTKKLEVNKHNKKKKKNKYMALNMDMETNEKKKNKSKNFKLLCFSEFDHGLLVSDWMD